MTLEDRIDALETLFLTLAERVTIIENGKTYISKYAHVFDKLDNVEVSKTITIETRDLTESNRIVSCIARFAKKSEKTFRTMSGENCVVILRIS